MNRRKIYDDQLIVITGALGFIGSGVVRYLNDQGFSNLLLVDDFGTSQKWKNIRQKKFFDLLPPEELMDWLDGREGDIEAFIHLGACTDTREMDGDYLFENNYRFSIELAEYALYHNHRFIYASSAATYGNGQEGFKDNEELLESLKPLNMYGYSKHLFDLWLKRREVLDQVVGLKYFNVFGPNESHKERMASMVYHMTHQILETGKVSLFKSNDPLYKDGEQCRDFIYVKDVAMMTCQFLDSDLSGLYNVGTGQAQTWNRLASAVFKALGKKENIEYIDMPDDMVKSYQNYTAADMSKYRESLENKKLPAPHFTPLEEAVEDYLQNHLLKNEEW